LTKASDFEIEGAASPARRAHAMRGMALSLELSTLSLDYDRNHPPP
jgi:hypothetical protein